MSRVEVEQIQGVIPEWWDELMRSSQGGHYYQSSLYARFLHRYEGGRPILWCARANGAPVALLLTRRAGGGLSGVLRRGLLWECGPVILNEQAAEEATKAILQAVSQYARRNLLFFIGPVTPPYHHDGISEKTNMTFTDQGFEQSPGATFVIDGRVGMDQCWKNLSSTARKAVRKAEKRGVTVRVVGPGEMTSEIIATYNECRARQRLSLLKRTYAKAFDDVFQEEACFFLAFHQERIVSLLGCILFGQVMLEFMAGQTEVDVGESLGGNDLIRWRVIQYAVEQRVSYDQSGVAPNAQSSKEKGIFRFKEKWGGQYVPYHIWKK